MTNLLLIVLLAVLAGVYGELKKLRRKFLPEPPAASYEAVLPDFLHKYCEIRLKQPLAELNLWSTVRGEVTDLDRQWIRIESCEKQKRTVRLLRTDNIAGIKEIVQR